MDDFKKREKAEEAKFARNEELHFRAQARRNRQLGLWAADLMGLSESDAEKYAQEVIKSDFEEPGDEDVFRKIRGDFDKNNIEQSDHQIRRTMDELLARAIKQLENAS